MKERAYQNGTPAYHVKKMGDICGEKLRDVLLNFLAIYTTITQFGKFGKKWKKPDNIPLLYGGPYKLDSKFTVSFRVNSHLEFLGMNYCVNSSHRLCVPKAKQCL